jgi:hypothetical protein
VGTRLLARWLPWLGIMAGALMHARKALGGGLFAEDGAVLFARHWQQLDLARCFEPYNGYASLLPNVVAALLCRLPTEWIPLAMQLAAVAIGIAACGLLLHPGFERVAAARVRAVAAVALAWAPYGTFATSTVLMYCNVWALLAALLLALLPPARSRAALVMRALAAALCAWTHPLSGAFAVLPWLSPPGERSRSVGIALALGASTWLLWGRGGATTLHPAHAVATWAPFVLARVGFETVFGTGAKAWLLGLDAPASVLALGALALAAVTWAARRVWTRQSAAWRRFVVALVLAIGATTFGALLARGGEVDWRDTWGERYPFVARLALLLVAVTALGTRIAVRHLVVGLVVVLGAQLLVHREWRRSFGHRGEHAFVATLAAAELRLGDRRLVAARLERDRFPIVIVARAPR